MTVLIALICIPIALAALWFVFRCVLGLLDILGFDGGRADREFAIQTVRLRTNQMRLETEELLKAQALRESQRNKQ